MAIHLSDLKCSFHRGTDAFNVLHADVLNWQRKMLTKPANATDLTHTQELSLDLI